MGQNRWHEGSDVTEHEHIKCDEQVALKLLEDQVRKYDFYQLITTLNKMSSINSGALQLIFSTDPSLEFALSDLVLLEKLNQEDRRYKLVTSFFGLHGAISPLPSFLLERIALDEHGIQRAFLDFFNHRLLELTYQLWRKYRYYACYQRDGSDIFSNYLFSIMGLSDPNIDQLILFDKNKLLPFASIIASKSCSVKNLQLILLHYFDLTNISIKQWQVRDVKLSVDDLSFLGAKNHVLGSSAILGETIKDCMGKFTIVIKNITQAQCCDFLPHGINNSILRQLLKFLLPNHLSCDLELSLKDDEIKPTQLAIQTKDSLSGTLGWFSFLGTKKNHTKIKLTLQI